MGMTDRQYDEWREEQSQVIDCAELLLTTYHNGTPEEYASVRADLAALLTPKAKRCANCSHPGSDPCPVGCERSNPKQNKPSSRWGAGTSPRVRERPTEVVLYWSKEHWAWEITRDKESDVEAVFVLSEIVP
jgi:hypothetical protein